MRIYLPFDSVLSPLCALPLHSGHSIALNLSEHIRLISQRTWLSRYIIYIYPTLLFVSTYEVYRLTD